MNIVILAQFAGSIQHGMVYGHYYLAREWVRLGHDVTIISASFSHSRTTQPEVGWRTKTQFIDGIRYCWIPTACHAAASNIGRVRNIVAYSLRCLVKIRGVPPPDVVVCSSHHPFAIYAAKKMARRHGSVLVFEVRDLWPLTLIELGGISARHPFVRLMQCAEDYAYKHADAVVSVLPNAKEYMIGRGMRPEKFMFVPNGVDISTDPVFQSLPYEHAQAIKKLRCSGRFVVGYAGSLNRANVLHTLIEAASMCEDSSIGVAILGRGPALPELRKLARDLGAADRVIFLDAVTKPQVRGFLAKVDAAYVGLQHKDFYRYGVSLTKFNDYMLAGCPIVAAMDTPGNLVLESSAGVVCAPERAVDLLQAINSLREMSRQQRYELGDRGRAWIIQNRNYEVLAQQFLDGVINRAPA